MQLLKTDEHHHHSIWLHIGAGAFHRAHQSWYLHKLSQLGESSWSLALGNLRNSATQATVDQLAKQQGVYTLELTSPEGEITYEHTDAIRFPLAWDEHLQPLITTGADKHTKIISFTITKDGYFLKEDGHLDS